jgi:hypothetical protein
VKHPVEPIAQDAVDVHGVLRRAPLWIEGIPSHHLMLERAEDTIPDRLPVYSLGMVARVFFGMTPQALSSLIRRISVEEWAEHPMQLPARNTEALSRSSWTLAEVERVARALFSMEKIQYDRLVIALHLIAWTAKAYGVYV